MKERIRVPFLAFLVISSIAISAVMDLPPLLKCLSARSWKETPGISRRAGLASVRIGKDPLWHPVVVYHYNVDGQEYVNDVVAFQDYQGLPGYEGNIFRTRYSTGTAVTVKYNPANPEESCLEADPHFDVYFIHLVMYGLFSALIYLSCYPPIKPDDGIEPGPNPAD